ncbi:glucose-6-phosphate isomerase [Peptococcaceae bacterium CEB3]|nr:glucose-6-phosphate isomerase [Peptococcaceae bacterium CEB3]
MSGAEDYIDFAKPFSIYFNLLKGLSDTRKPSQRRLSNMKHMYFNDEAYNKMLDADDSLVYEFYELGTPENAGDIAFGTSIVYPGKVGNEYFMTKGHFHNVLDTAEVYICLQGQGFMLLENPEGDWKTEELRPGQAVYCAIRYAHRSINVGNEPLVTFFAFRGDAGHDYGTIEKKGYRKLIVEMEGTPSVVDNPNWK